MLKRVITGAVFTAIILGGIYLRGWALRALMLAAMLIGMFEVYRAIKKTGAKPAEWAGYAYAARSRSDCRRGRTRPARRNGCGA